MKTGLKLIGKALGITIVAMSSQHAFSQEKAPPSLKEWVRSWESANEKVAKTKSFVETLVFAEKIPAKGCPKLLTFKAPIFSEISYVKASDPVDLSWTYALNEKRLRCAKGKVSQEDSLIELFSLSGVDTVILQGQKKWKFYTMADGKPRFSYAAAAPSDFNESIEVKLHSWLEESLGFEAIVVDKRGDYVLTKANPKYYRPKVQALAIANSETKIALPEKARKGSALLQLIAAEGQYGLFRVLTYGKQSGEMGLGTKLLVQK